MANLFPLNNSFETAPSFTAAQTGANWIDGTATGSSVNNAYAWALYSLVGTVATQFDTAQSHTGSYSLKLSTLAASSLIMDANSILSGVARLANCVPVQPSTAYTFTYWMKTNVTSGSGLGAFGRLIEFQSDGNTTNTTSDGTRHYRCWYFNHGCLVR